MESVTASVSNIQVPPPEEQSKEIAPFLRSLRRMLDLESDDILCWTPDGKAFEIHDMEVMTSYILPKYFKHRKYTSFQRQLNYFNFRKWTKSRAVVCTFSNPYFLRDQPELTWRITRKRGLNAEGKNPATPIPQMPSPVLASKPAITSEAEGKKTADTSDDIDMENVETKASADDVVMTEESESEICELQSDSESLEWVDTLYPSLEMIEADDDIDRRSISPPQTPPRAQPQQPERQQRATGFFFFPTVLTAGYVAL